MEPVAWVPKDGLMAEGAESGTKFTEMDFTEEDEFADYDEKAGESVSIMNITSEFNVTKEKK